MRPPSFLVYTLTGNGVPGWGGDGGPVRGGVLNAPLGMAGDPTTGHLHILDTGNHRVRKVAAGLINNFAGNGGAEGSSTFTTEGGVFGAGVGTGGPATSAELNSPAGIVFDAAGNAYISEYGGARVRKVAAVTGVISSYCGTGQSGYAGDGGPATLGQLNGPWGVAWDSQSGSLFVSDAFNSVIRRVSAGGNVSTFAGTGVFGFAGDAGPASAALLTFPTSLWLAGGVLYIADSNNNRVRGVTLATGVITTLVGSGVQGVTGDGGMARSAQLSDPLGVAVDTSGNIFVADSANRRIRYVSASTGVIWSIMGVGGISLVDGTNADYSSAAFPEGVAIDSFGVVYIADTDNSVIRYCEWE